jgi:hypothetical protein
MDYLEKAITDWSFFPYFKPELCWEAPARQVNQSQGGLQSQGCRRECPGPAARSLPHPCTEQEMLIFCRGCRARCPVSGPAARSLPHPCTEHEMLIFCRGSRARCLGSTTFLKKTAWLQKLQYSGGCFRHHKTNESDILVASTSEKSDKSLEFFYYIIVDISFSCVKKPVYCIQKHSCRRYLLSSHFKGGRAIPIGKICKILKGHHPSKKRKDYLLRSIGLVLAGLLLQLIPGSEDHLQGIHPLPHLTWLSDQASVCFKSRFGRSRAFLAKILIRKTISSSCTV